MIINNEGNQSDIIHTDFTKAFDRVTHFLSSIKLNNIGIGNSMLSWITSFISNRIQIIKYKNCLYKFHPEVRKDVTFLYFYSIFL